MLSEAQDEFEKVVSLVPDNLLAHKKLAEIYYKHGEADKALKECQAVLNLNPNDEEVKTMMTSLEPQPPEPEKPAEQTPSTQADDFQDRKDTADTVEQQAESHIEEIKETPVYEIYEEVSGAELGIEIPEKLTPVAEEPVNEELKEFRKVVDLHTEKSSTEETEQEQPDPDMPEIVPVADEVDKNQRNTEDKITISMSTETMADIYISQGLYDKAMDIYKEILSSEPENKRIIQKSEELKMLIKLKDKKP